MRRSAARTVEDGTAEAHALRTVFGGSLTVVEQLGRAAREAGGEVDRRRAAHPVGIAGADHLAVEAAGSRALERAQPRAITGRECFEIRLRERCPVAELRPDVGEVRAGEIGRSHAARFDGRLDRSAQVPHVLLAVGITIAAGEGAAQESRDAKLPSTRDVREHQHLEFQTVFGAVEQQVRGACGTEVGVHAADQVAVGSQAAERSVPVERQPGERCRRTAVAGSQHHDEFGELTVRERAVRGTVAASTPREIDVRRDQAAR